MHLRAGEFKSTFPRPALVMGIINATPDSFSDGGQFLAPELAIARAQEMVNDGAGIIDVGGESTRPGAAPVSESEELRRVMPIIEGLVKKIRVPISIDTMKVEVARMALEAGASMVNDVGANREDAAMWQLVAETGVGYVCVHMQGTPPTIQSNPKYTNVAAEVKEFFLERMERLRNNGVQAEQIIFDPGIGFGKTAEHNLQLLGALRTFTSLPRPILIGVSRKSFITKLLGNGAAARLNGSLACACLASEAGVQIIRAHDVKETAQVIGMTEEVVGKRDA